MSFSGIAQLMPRRPVARSPISQCCPNCGAPATRNVLHCEYCLTQFTDATPGVDIYALCDFDPEYGTPAYYTTRSTLSKKQIATIKAEWAKRYA